MQTTGSGLKPGGTTSTSIGVAAARQSAGRAGDVKISPHSNMIYWWIV